MNGKGVLPVLCQPLLIAYYALRLEYYVVSLPVLHRPRVSICSPLPFREVWHACAPCSYEKTQCMFYIIRYDGDAERGVVTVVVSTLIVSPCTAWWPCRRGSHAWVPWRVVVPLDGCKTNLSIKCSVNGKGVPPVLCQPLSIVYCSLRLEYYVVSLPVCIDPVSLCVVPSRLGGCYMHVHHSLMRKHKVCLCHKVHVGIERIRGSFLI